MKATEETAGSWIREHVGNLPREVAIAAIDTIVLVSGLLARHFPRRASARFPNSAINRLGEFDPQLTLRWSYDQYYLDVDIDGEGYYFRSQVFHTRNPIHPVRTLYEPDQLPHQVELLLRGPEVDS